MFICNSESEFASDDLQWGYKYGPHYIEERC